MLENNTQYTPAVDIRTVIMKALIFVGLLIIIGYAATQIIALNSLDVTRSDSDISQRTLAMSEYEEQTVFVTLSNQQELFERLPGVASNVANQVYAEHYKQTGTLERTAEIVGSVRKSGDTYTFATRFLPSNNIMDTTVTMTDTPRGLYTIETKRRGNE